MMVAEKRMKFYGIIERVNLICDKNDKKIDERKFWGDKENRQHSQNFHVVKIISILKIYWQNTISNEELLNRIGMTTISQTTQTRRWL